MVEPGKALGRLDLSVQLSIMTLRKSKIRLPVMVERKLLPTLLNATPGSLWKVKGINPVKGSAPPTIKVVRPGRAAVG